MKNASSMKQSLLAGFALLLMAGCLNAAPAPSIHSQRNSLNIFDTVTNWLASAFSRPVKIPPPPPMPPS